ITDFFERKGKVSYQIWNHTSMKTRCAWIVRWPGVAQNDRPFEIVTDRTFVMPMK
ncbi:hypothetical protein L226DRAFT_469376, partial [Lentinus tigrinus ALCF2SS1-7]